jgi:preprotein translocase subunit SecA
MLKNLANAIGGNPQKKEFDRLRGLVDQIDLKESEYEKYDNEALRGLTANFKSRLALGESLDDILIDAFAAVREASKRTIGLRHFNVQLIGGITMHEGTIAEMRTGEGKTLVATLPLYLNALAGKGAHLVTVNDYLARRDARWMAPIYHFLGLSVGVLQSRREDEGGVMGYIVDLDARSIKEEEDQLRPGFRHQAYAADITYGTNNEFGFDYLRDNLITDIKNRVQRGHHYAIIDEVDNILIDEARTPLIISGPASEDVEWYSKMAVIVKQLDPEDYDFDEKDRSIALTEIGEIHVEELLQIPLRDPERPEDITPEQARLLGYLEQALRAELLYKNNKDYIVKNGEVIIVDEFTGRLMAGRRWSEGLHQAVEAKEGVEVKPENITHATITLQNYFRKYEKLAGMTGTALTEAEEFSTIYDLDVLEIPTNLDFESDQPGSNLITLKTKDDQGYTYTYYAEKEDPQQNAVYWKRKDYPDLVYRTEEGKLQAICLELIKNNILGRPQLIGTTSIEHSERLSDRLHADLIRRLLSINLIRQKWMRNNGVNFIERVVPELAPLNAPLPEINTNGLYQYAKKLGIDSIQLENEDNLNILLEFLDLEISQQYRDRLTAIINGGIGHQVLNARKHDQESQIIESAGAYQAVTIATNMAGRGVDIKLGGEIKETVLSDVRHILTRAEHDPYGMTNREMAEKLEKLSIELSESESESVSVFMQFLENMAKVRQAGGLHVIGSERHEARRIDNQLRGRAGRQGDPGSSRFYLSLEDDLMRMFGGERAEKMMSMFNLDPSLPIESKMIGRLVEQAQERVEGYNFDIRKHLLDYDDVLNDQREKIYTERDQVLIKEDLNQDVWGMLENEISQRVRALPDDPDGKWKLLAFLDEIQPTIFYKDQDIRLISFTIQLLKEYIAARTNNLSDTNTIRDQLIKTAQETLHMQKEHLIVQTQDFIQRTIDTFETQRAERIEMLDMFFDTLTDVDNQSMNEINSQLQKFVHLKISLDRDQVNQVLEGNHSTQNAIRELVSDQLKQIFLSRILLTIEQRIGQKLGGDTEELMSFSWIEILQKITTIIDERFSQYADLQNQPNHPIIQNIDHILKQQREDNQGVLDLGALLTEIAIGTQVAFNQETHQRMLRRVNVLNYVFFVANTCMPEDPIILIEKIIPHLKEAQDKLRFVWGKMEMQRIAQNNLQFSQLADDYRAEIESSLNEDSREILLDQDLSALSGGTYKDIIDAFGSKVQQIIYRHILLQSITELWMEHLTRMEALRVSIRMEAYAQRDPLVQYKSFSTDAFRELLANIRLSVVSKMFRMQPAKPSQISVDAPSRLERDQKEDKSGQNQQKTRKRHKKKR